jgi:glutaredoxin-related protein
MPVCLSAKILTAVMLSIDKMNNIVKSAFMRSVMQMPQCLFCHYAKYFMINVVVLSVVAYICLNVQQTVKALLKITTTWHRISQSNMKVCAAHCDIQIFCNMLYIVTKL